MRVRMHVTFGEIEDSAEMCGTCADCEHAERTVYAEKKQGYICRSERSPCRGRLTDAKDFCARWEERK